MNRIYFSLLMLGLLMSGIEQASAVSSGTYTIGPAGDFPDLTTAVSDLNGSTITGPVTFNIISGSYSGSVWKANITTITGTSSSNRVVFQAQPGGSVTISADGTSTDNYVIRLDNTDYITVQNIAIDNTNSSYGRVIDIAGTSSHCAVNSCVLTTSSSGSASTNERAVVYMGTSSGDDNIIQDNTLNNGYCGVYLNSTSSSAENDVISGNTILNTYKYFVYAAYASNLTVSNNTASGTNTSLTYGFYLSYNNDGGTVSNNDITINTSSSTHYGIYNNYLNANSTDITTFANNTVLVKGTSATCYSLYNNYSSHLAFTNNNFDATVTNGYTFLPAMAYGGTDVTATDNIFRAKATTGRVNYSTSYRFIHNGSTSSPNRIFVRNNVFNIESTSGYIGGSSSSGYFMYYPNNCSVSNNEFNISRTSSGTMYGLGPGYYFIYRGENTHVDSNDFNITYASGGTIYNFSYYYGFYYGKFNSFNNNSIDITSKNATTYAVGRYMFYHNDDGLEVKNNTVSVDNTSNSGSIYAPYYFAYYNTNADFGNNTFSIESGSGSIYSPYMMSYYNTATRVHDNTFNINATSASITAPYYLNAYGSSDTVENNTWNVTRTTGTYYAYNYYLNHLSRNNTWNINATSGTTYFYFYRGQGGIFEHNNVNITSTTGTIYGSYLYGGSTSYSTKLFNNKFTLKSNSGTIYGLYNYYYPGTNAFVGNVWTTKTSGNSQLYYTSYGYYGDQLLFNNTFHSNSTGSTNKFFKQSGGNSTHKGRAYLHNNIFSSTAAVSSNAIDINDTTYYQSNYNLYYAPGGVSMKALEPAVTTSDFNDWKTGTGLDMHSLVHDPGYVDAANGDVRPDPANANSWAVQGRGIHLDKDTMDILGNPRARDRFEGVPDLGAYEFTPTSIPPDADAFPATPSANSKQVFTFGGDTVCSISWGATVPSSIAIRQHTGMKASPITPSFLERAYFYIEANAPLGVYDYTPEINYQDHWIGNISEETNARIAKSSNGGAWAGYNYTNGITDTVDNLLMPKEPFDSLKSSFTAVENARIGIRCVVPPQNLINYDITAFAATEQWDTVFVPIGYQLAFDSLYTINPSAIQFSTSNIYPISNLTENTTYYVHVRTICGVKDTSDWSADTFRTMITCHAPTLATASVTDKQAVVYWDTVQTAEKYEYAITESATPPAYGTTIFTNTVLGAGLKSGTTYYAHVRSYCNTIYDMSGWSTEPFTTAWPANVDEINGTRGISAYPNPVHDVLNVNLATNPGTSARLTLSNIAGTVVYSAPVTASKAQVDMNAMPAGLYLLKYADDEKSYVIKVTKE